MFGVWQSGELFWKGQEPWYVSESQSVLEDFAARNIQNDGRKPFYFVEAVGSVARWTENNLRCVGHMTDQGGPVNLGKQKQQDGHILKRRNQIAKGCPLLTEDERARKASNIDERCGGVIPAMSEALRPTTPEG